MKLASGTVPVVYVQMSTGAGFAVSNTHGNSLEQLFC